jgi:hypothetical protein
VEWHWLYDPHRTERRQAASLLARQARKVTDLEKAHLLLDNNFSLADVTYRIHHNIVESSQRAGPSPAQYALYGFRNTHNIPLWTSLLEDYILQFDPEIFTTR